MPQAECKHAADAKSALEQQLASAQLRLDKAEAARKQQLAQLEALQEQLDAAQAAGSEHDGAARAAGERAAAAVDAAEMLRAQLATARDQLSAKEQLLAVRWGRLLVCTVCNFKAGPWLGFWSLLTQRCDSAHCRTAQLTAQVACRLRTIAAVTVTPSHLPAPLRLGRISYPAAAGGR